MKYLFDIQHAPGSQKIGNKADSLRKLQKWGFSVPKTWVIPARISKMYDIRAAFILKKLRESLNSRINPKCNFAIRSSGIVEDGTERSYAGQFMTLLNISGIDGILAAVEKVYADASSRKLSPYNTVADKQVSGQEMAIIIQEMVQPEWSGVGFSINPVTGRNEVVIEGIKGSGEQLVQEGKTPGRWIWHQGTWEDIDNPDSPGRQVLEEIVNFMLILRKKFRTEIDVEWAWDGKKLWLLQCRAVTTARYPVIYSNHISREVLPGMIKPLVWSVNIPLVNSAWIRLLEKIMGPLDIKPEALSKSFYYRAYFNMGTLGSIFRMMGLPRDSLESLMGRKNPSGKSNFKPGIKTIRYLPRMIWFLLGLPKLGKRFRKALKIIESKTSLLNNQLEKFTPEKYPELFQGIYTLSASAAYWNIIIPLTMQVTNRMLNKKAEKKGVAFSDLDMSNDFPLLSELDPQEQIRKMSRYLKKIPLQKLANIKDAATLEAQAKDPDLAPFVKDFEETLLKFGHFSESGNDFSYVPWREDPDFLLKIVIEGVENNNIPAGKVYTENENVSGLKSTRSFRRAGQFRIYREMISSAYVKSYGLFRQLFLHTGKYLYDNGLIHEPGDIFYLTLEEHDSLINGSMSLNNKQARDKIAEVKQEMKEMADVTLPSVIYGEYAPPVHVKKEKIMHGIPTSPGIFSGEIIVVKGYTDFSKPVEGKILVIPFSDVGWTPILVKAGAIVSESGGMLSHASIIARELGLPAVSSIDHVCNLEDGRMASVDGTNGILLLD